MNLTKTLSIFALWGVLMLPIATFAADDGFEKRLEIAKQIQEVRPVKDQVDGAIDQYIASRIPLTQQASYRRALEKAVSYKALEKISADAYAETFTEEELRAMLDYYKKPESVSAAKKVPQYTGIVLPEIARMLDRAMMRVRTGGE
ncbi:MAG: DUF2059 domain-containing protein [Pseudomonadota bacterium]